ncbi:TetR/AcrR family transcriptional regulator [Nitratireductor luteus]|uniref:TetR/AcrR family transcriptional regulator n=1 Tax=Nitratireductor luteus TaxID=2976980 RepID=UPI00223F53A0|nr:TetR/AcrR family transcriptional regulator [Nitratireductor luteus]
MSRRSDTGEMLRAAAQTVAYRDGVGSLTLATVAEEAERPIGSLYYHFKTRDDVVLAVVDRLSSQMEARIASWDSLVDPEKALIQFTEVSRQSAQVLAQCGCPIGSLTAQLRKHPGEAGARAGGILGELAHWAGRKYAELGLRPDEAHREGRAMLVALEGAAMMAHATGDMSFVIETVDRLQAGISRLASLPEPPGALR